MTVDTVAVLTSLLIAAVVMLILAGLFMAGAWRTEHALARHLKNARADRAQAMTAAQEVRADLTRCAHERERALLRLGELRTQHAAVVAAKAVDVRVFTVDRPRVSVYRDLRARTVNVSADLKAAAQVDTLTLDELRSRYVIPEEGLERQGVTVDELRQQIAQSIATSLTSKLFSGDRTS